MAISQPVPSHQSWPENSRDKAFGVYRAMDEPETDGLHRRRRRRLLTARHEVSGTGRVLGLQRSSSREAMSRHADLRSRDVQGERHTVGAEVPRMSPEELLNQAATRIHWRIMPTA